MKNNITVSFRLNTWGTKKHASQITVGFGGMVDEKGKYLRLLINTGHTFLKSDWNENRNLPKEPELAQKFVRLEQTVQVELQDKTEGYIQTHYKNDVLWQEVKSHIDFFLHDKPREEEEYPTPFDKIQQSKVYPSHWIKRLKEFSFKIINNKNQEIDPDKFFDFTLQIQDVDSMIKTMEQIKIELAEIDQYPTPFWEYIKKVGELKKTIPVGVERKPELKDNKLYNNISTKFKEFDEEMTLGRMTDQISVEFVDWVLANSDIERVNSLNNVTKILSAVFTFAIEKDKYSFPEGKKAVLPNIDVKDKSIYGKQEEAVDAVYVDENRLEQLANYTSEDKKKEYVAHLFAINASGFGARFSDIHKVFNVRQELINGNMVWLVHYADQKTGKNGAVPISNKVKLLIDRYPEFEKVYQQDFNELIKEVGKDLGWTEEVTHTYKKLNAKPGEEEFESITKPFHNWLASHSCRRSFCTNAWLKKDANGKRAIENWVIMMFSKHKSEEVFLNYVKAKKLMGMHSYIDSINGKN